MAINFPDNPSLNQTFTANDRTWVWNGSYWKSISSSTSIVDADTLDGQDGSYYLNYSNFTNIPETAFPVETKSANFTANSNTVYLIDTSAQNVIVTLPTTSLNDVSIVLDIFDASNVVFVDPTTNAIEEQSVGDRAEIDTEISVTFSWDETNSIWRVV